MEDRIAGSMGAAKMISVYGVKTLSFAMKDSSGCHDVSPIKRKERSGAHILL